MNQRSPFAFAAIAILFALPAWATEPTPTPAAATAASLCAAPAPTLAASLFEEPGLDGECTANCWDGSSVTCSGSTCNAVDSSCSSGEDGYCYGSSTGTKACTPCGLTCIAKAGCSDGSIISCKGTNGDCFAENHCYVYCNGEYTYCPVPGSTCPF